MSLWQIQILYLMAAHHPGSTSTALANTLRSKSTCGITLSDDVCPIIHDPVCSSAMNCQVAVGVDGSIGWLHIHSTSQTLSFKVILPHISRDKEVASIRLGSVLLKGLFASTERGDTYSAATSGLSSQEQARTNEE